MWNFFSKVLCFFSLYSGYLTNYAHIQFFNWKYYTMYVTLWHKPNIFDIFGWKVENFWKWPQIFRERIPSVYFCPCNDWNRQNIIHAPNLCCSSCDVKEVLSTWNNNMLGLIRYYTYTYRYSVNITFKSTTNLKNSTGKISRSNKLITNKFFTFNKSNTIQWILKNKSNYIF